MMHTKAEKQKNFGLAGGKRMSKFSLLQNFIASQSGATAIEYALIAGGISIAIVISGSILGGNVAAMFNTVQSAVN
jgi:pilus assembly protein Flp/PilA